MRSKFSWSLVALALPILCGCQVTIASSTAHYRPPGNSIAVSANTVNQGTSPTGVTIRYQHKRAADLTVSAEQAAAVSSAGNHHEATLAAPPGDTFEPFDRVTFAWRVNFNTWGTTSSNTATDAVYIDPTLRVQISPNTVTAGGVATGVVSIGQAFAKDIVAELEVVDVPQHTSATLAPSIVTIPAGSIVSNTFTIQTQHTPPPPPPPGSGSSGGIPGPSSGNSHACKIRATVTVNGIGSFVANETFQLLEP